MTDPEPDEEAPLPNGELPTSDERTVQLVRSARAGDREAVGELIQRLEPAIQAQVRHEWYQTRGGYSAEDIESTVIGKVVGALEQFEGIERRQLRSWVQSICSNKIRDVLRRIQSQKRSHAREGRLHTEMDFAQQSPSPRTAFIRREASSELQRALRQLADADREIISEHDLDGRALRTIASSQGISEEAAKKRLQRARARLRKIMLDGGREG